MKEKVKVPELRFSGFTDDWEERKIKDIFKITRGQVLAATETSEEKSDISPFPVYSSQTKNNGLMGYYKDYLFDTAITWTTDGANAGTVSYRSGRFYSTNVNGVLISDKGYTNKAISEILNLEAWKWVSHVGNPKLMNNVMGDISIMIPSSFEEQDRLSDFLNQLDGTIALHQRKLDLLKEQKKGYLQKMFPKNGSKIPELRFEGFTDDWELRKFGEMLVNLEAGVSVNSSDYDTGYFILKTSAIKMGNIDLLEVKSIVSEEVARAKTPLIKNSIIISRMNTPELVGASGLVRESIDNIFLPDRLWQGQVAGNFSPEWLIQSINIAANIKKIRDLATGTSGSMKNISKKSMLDLIINVPTLEEQQKIGSFFKQLDDVIALHQLKLDLLKEQKKGFLQKMFA
ncbi:restriction endonuclease subunit S [Lactococcus lactis]|uniref:restriction endonuclease subunit S n=1 Tax=Lactococcus lactis TaxID=1358 RepID=UPI00024D8DAE|nr:restriction endonuclease subunit S [Lactococcus lactis]BAL50831.1 type I restriction enzyme, S subunit [Lactococcus lactis subsp. lactis IO-1]